MTNPKITQDKLEEEIQDGKTYKEIAHEYGYGYPSRSLSKKIRDLGYRKLNKMNFYSSGGANIPLSQDDIEEACQERDIDTGGDLFYETDVSNGKIEIIPKERKLVKE